MQSRVLTIPTAAETAAWVCILQVIFRVNSSTRAWLLCGDSPADLQKQKAALLTCPLWMQKRLARIAPVPREAFFYDNFQGIERFRKALANLLTNTFMQVGICFFAGTCICFPYGIGLSKSCSFDLVLRCEVQCCAVRYAENRVCSVHAYVQGYCLMSCVSDRAWPSIQRTCSWRPAAARCCPQRSTCWASAAMRCSSLRPTTPALTSTPRWEPPCMVLCGDV